MHSGRCRYGCDEHSPEDMRKVGSPQQNLGNLDSGPEQRSFSFGMHNLAEEPAIGDIHLNDFALRKLERQDNGDAGFGNVHDVTRSEVVGIA